MDDVSTEEQEGPKKIRTVKKVYKLRIAPKTENGTKSNGMLSTEERKELEKLRNINKINNYYHTISLIDFVIQVVVTVVIAVAMMKIGFSASVSWWAGIGAAFILWLLF